MHTTIPGTTIAPAYTPIVEVGRCGFRMDFRAMPEDTSRMIVRIAEHLEMVAYELMLRPWSVSIEDLTPDDDQSTIHTYRAKVLESDPTFPAVRG